MIMSMELCMAHCYRHMDTKYYPDAMGLYEKILNRDENEIGASEASCYVRNIVKLCFLTQAL